MASISTTNFTMSDREEVEESAKGPPPAHRLLARMLAIVFLSTAIACGIAVGVIYGRESKPTATGDDQEVSLTSPWDDQGVSLTSPWDDQEVSLTPTSDDQEVSLIPTLDDQGVSLTSPWDDQEVSLTPTLDDQGVSLTSPWDDQEVSLTPTLDDQGVSLPPPLDDFVYRQAAVAADAAHCSEIGKDMLLKGGSAIDAAIAGLLCVGLYSVHSAGIGGGSFIMYYDRETETPYFIDSREVAPMDAYRDMYANESSDASTIGGLAIAVPGEILGYWEAHQRFGNLSWGELFQPSIQLAENGFIVGPDLARTIAMFRELAMNDSSLREIMLDENGNLLEENSTMYRRKLAQTMRTVAAEGAEAFYNGSLAAAIAAEIQERGGIITMDDLAQYQVAVKTPLSIDLNGYKTYTCPPPCSGAVYSLIMNILEGYKFNTESRQSVGNETLTYHRIIEAFKFAFAKRSALGDEDFVDVDELVANLTSQDYADGLRSRITDDRTHETEYYEPSFQVVQDSGTSHIAVVDQYGNAASITSTINTFFGSTVRGPITGILYNNEMDDFSKPGGANFFGLPPSPSNFIEPGKRPLSSMTPVIMVDSDGEVKLVVGAAGGTTITTGTSLVSMETLWFGSTLRDGGETKRVHQQLLPNITFYEPGLPQEVVDGLNQKGQEMQEFSTIYSVVQAINRLEDGWLEAYCDGRRDGIPAGF